MWPSRWCRWPGRSGYDVVIVDPRSAFATERASATPRSYATGLDEALPNIGLHAARLDILMIHDPKMDDPALIPRHLPPMRSMSGAGSKKTHAKRVERLLRAGVPAAHLERIHAPIGLDIGRRVPRNRRVDHRRDHRGAAGQDRARQMKVAAIGPPPAALGMGPSNKLIEPIDGKLMVAHAARVALDSGAAPVIVITGFDAPRVAQRSAILRGHRP